MKKYLLLAILLFSTHSRAEETATPSVAPHVMEGTDTYVTLDFLWWKTTMGAMEYATTGVIDGGRAVPIGKNTSEGRVQKAGFTFEPGIKFGMGMNFSHDGWDLYAEYTRLASLNKSNSIASSPGIGATNLYTYIPNQQVPLSSASCHWKQTLSAAELTLGRDHFISPSLTMRPSAGLKTAWINEQSKISYVPLDTVNPANPNSLETAVLLTYRQNMWGLGIKTALNVRWHLTKNWSFYNDFAFSALWSDFHVHQKQNVSETIYGQQTTLYTKETIKTVIPVFEGGGGISYIVWLDKSRYRFEFRGGWEEQIWLDFNHYTKLGGTGNLAMQGLTLKATLNF